MDPTSTRAAHHTEGAFPELSPRCDVTFPRCAQKKGRRAGRYSAALVPCQSQEFGCHAHTVFACGHVFESSRHAHPEYRVGMAHLEPPVLLAWTPH
jgi:hypothetical protein